MEQVFSCVIPYIHDGNDLNSVSSVSSKLYQLDSLTRKHLTVHVHYTQNPSRVSQRFPYIESLTLVGFPHEGFALFFDIDITEWILEICVNFKFLKALHIRGMVVGDKDLELLARSRGKDLRSLRIHKCVLDSEDGLMYISSYCNELRTLCLENNTLDSCGNGKWLCELALRNMVIETFHFGWPLDRYDVKDVTLLAKNCCNSLVSLRIGARMLRELREAFRHAVRLEDFSGAYADEDEDYTGFKYLPIMRCLGIYDLPFTSLASVLPYVNQIRELKLECLLEPEVCQCFLFTRCPNLEVLYTQDKCGDTGLHLIAQFCKKLRKFIHYGRVTYIGLTDLARGCYNLKYLDVNLLDISNEVMKCIGTHLKNLRDLRMDLVKDCMDVPLDNGIRAMLKGCNKLERLAIHLFNGGLTDVGLGYIGKYGRNLVSLSLKSTGESDAGLLELSKGCQKLRKLKLKNCPFGEQAVATLLYNICSLRYISVLSGPRTILALTRPTVPAEVLAEPEPHIIVAEKFHNG